MPTPGSGAQKSRARSDGDATDAFDRFQMKRTNYRVASKFVRKIHFSISDGNVHERTSICARLERGIATFGHSRTATKLKLVFIDTNIGV